jgi:hypothetical protein
MLYKKVQSPINFASSKDDEIKTAVKVSIVETAARAAVTATVTFAVGWVLKRTFEKSVAHKVAQTAGRTKPSMATNSPAINYKQSSKRGGSPAADKVEGAYER